MEMEKLNEMLQLKDKNNESEQKQVVLAPNSMKDNEEQLVSIQKPSELEKLNKHPSNENLQLLK